MKSGFHLQQINMSLSYCACILLLHRNRITEFDHQQEREGRVRTPNTCFSVKPTEVMRVWSENTWPEEHFVWAGCCENERRDGQNVKRTNNFSLTQDLRSQRANGKHYRLLEPHHRDPPRWPERRDGWNKWMNIEGRRNKKNNCSSPKETLVHLQVGPAVRTG